MRSIIVWNTQDIIVLVFICVIVIFIFICVVYDRIRRFFRRLTTEANRPRRGPERN